MTDRELPEENQNLPARTDAGQLQEATKSEAAEMPFLDHLEELRWRLLKAIVALIAGAIICFAFADSVFAMLTYPYYDAVQSMESSRSTGAVQAIRELLDRWIGTAVDTEPRPEPATALPPSRRLQALRPLTIFLMELQIALMGGFVLALPVVFFQLWRFVAPGLLAREKRLVLPIIALSVACFLIGASIAYYIVLPLGLRFFLGLESENVTSQWAIDEYISFVLKLLLGFGLVFEMPVIALFLSRIGLLTAAYLRRVRRYGIVGIFVLGALFTPPDPISQILMALPLLVLYEVSIWVCHVAGKKPDPEKIE